MDKLDKDKKLEELLKTDFTLLSNSKEQILNHLLLKINNNELEERKKYMNKPYVKKFIVKPVLSALVITVLFGGFSLTSYGQDFYKVIKEAFVGKHAQYIVTDQAEPQNFEIPNELKGKLYDKNGNVLESFKDIDAVYNENGNEIIIEYQTLSADKDGKEISEYKIALKGEDDSDSNMTVFKEQNEAKKYLAFDFTLPSYMPEGYAFNRIQVFNDEDGKPAPEGEYAYIYFSNGDKSKEIYLQLRLMNEETGYSADIGDFEEIDINGNHGVLSEKSLDIEINGVMYMFSASNAGIDNSQLVKMAESIKF